MGGNPIDFSLLAGMGSMVLAVIVGCGAFVKLCRKRRQEKRRNGGERPEQTDPELSTTARDARAAGCARVWDTIVKKAGEARGESGAAERPPDNAMEAVDESLQVTQLPILEGLFHLLSGPDHDSCAPSALLSVAKAMAPTALAGDAAPRAGGQTGAAAAPDDSATHLIELQLMVVETLAVAMQLQSAPAAPASQQSGLVHGLWSVAQAAYLIKAFLQCGDRGEF